MQTGHVDRIVYIYSISLGLLATAFIHLNNMRDTESDAPAGKLTLASLLGLRLSRTLYVILVVGAYAPIVALGLPRNAPHICAYCTMDISNPGYCDHHCLTHS